MADFLMPALGADMETGTVVEWRVRAGDRVRRGDVVAVVETHKGAIDVECFLEGVIGDLVPIGAALPVGAVLATVRAEGEVPAPATGLPVGAPAAAGAAARPAAMDAPMPAPPRAAVTTEVPSSTAQPAGSRARVTPAAGRRAAELGLAPDAMNGTGADGAVTLADIELAARARPTPPAPAASPAGVATPRAAKAGFDPVLMRQAIAAAMSRSKREIPHYYLGSTVDFAAAQGWLEAYNADRPPAERLLPAVLLLKAAALGLRAVPQLNGFWEHDAFRPAAAVHAGWAIALRGGGLVAPAIHDSDRKTLPELMAALRDLVQRARAGGLRSSELTDPTVTVTSLGDRGAESVLGVIYPPQVAILGFGRVVMRPWVVDGAVVARPVVTLSLAADHRASDGHVGGQLLSAIDAALQHPERL